MIFALNSSPQDNPSVKGSLSSISRTRWLSGSGHLAQDLSHLIHPEDERVRQEAKNNFHVS